MLPPLVSSFYRGKNKLVLVPAPRWWWRCNEQVLVQFNRCPPLSFRRAPRLEKPLLVVRSLVVVPCMRRQSITYAYHMSYVSASRSRNADRSIPVTGEHEHKTHGGVSCQAVHYKTPINLAAVLYGKACCTSLMIYAYSYDNAERTKSCAHLAN